MCASACAPQSPSRAEPRRGVASDAMRDVHERRLVLPFGLAKEEEGIQMG
jgi:hypothetical protein